MTELDDALAYRDSILDSMLALSEYAPISLKRQALNTFLLTGHMEQDQPMRLREAQAEVLRLTE